MFWLFHKTNELICHLPFLQHFQGNFYFFQSAVLILERTKRDGLWSGFAWTDFCCQFSGILWVKKFPNTTHPWRVHMELTLKSMEDIRRMMDHLSWTMEASIITGGVLRKNCVHMITKLERLKTWLNFISSHTWPSLQVLVLKLKTLIFPNRLPGSTFSCTIPAQGEPDCSLGIQSTVS